MHLNITQMNESHNIFIRSSNFNVLLADIATTARVININLADLPLFDFYLYIYL